MKFAYFVSGHGFGHISRSFEIIKKLISLGHSVILFTDRQKFLEGFTSENLKMIHLTTDLGVSQSSSLEIDLDLTKQKILEFQSQRLSLESEIVEILKKDVPDRIVSDASSFPFLLSRRLKIRGIFLGNFTWDFIYAHYGKEDSFFQDYADSLSLEYALADSGIVLPFHCPIQSIANLKYVGLVGRKPTESRLNLRKKLNFKDELYYLLFSFGAYGLDPKKFQFGNLEKNFRIVTSGLVDFSGTGVQEVSGVSYPDLLHACDAVVTKPGYGILAEAYFADTPILFTDRGNFIEYDYLVESLKLFHRSAYISQDELFSLKFTEKFLSLISSKDIPQKELEDGIPEIIQTFLS